LELRPLRLPQDLIPLGKMICHTFQYPENPEWSVQTDEKEQIVDTIRIFRRLWPLVRLGQYLSPSLRDMLRGYVAVEDGRIVGLTMVHRHGTTDTWVVGTVGVLPEYRRRGLARAILESALELMRKRGARRAWLSVINGNTPAQRLYESLGFEVYDAMIDYTLTAPSLPSVPEIPDGYSISRLPRSDWRTRFELEERIVPEETRRYEPVEPGRFRQPLPLLLLLPIINRAQHTAEEAFVVRETDGDKAVAWCRYAASTRGKGVNSIAVRLDPARPELADYLVGRMLHEVVSKSPNLRVEIDVPRWMPAVAAAVESFGFKRRVEYLKMGLEL